MNEFRVECYISDINANETKLSYLNEQALLKWKTDIESSALSEYYNKKIKLKIKKN